MEDAVQRMLDQIEPGGKPPLDQWHPQLSGVIDIRIDPDGRWFHEGGEITRFELVKLFASILRYEDDNGFVLVTPVEKWKIQVEDAPFIAVAMARREHAGQQQLVFATNVGDEVLAGPDHPLTMQSRGGSRAPYLAMGNGLTAKLSRPVYYELAAIVDESDGETGVWSAGAFFTLQ